MFFGHRSGHSRVFSECFAVSIGLMFPTQRMVLARDLVGHACKAKWAVDTAVMVSFQYESLVRSNGFGS